MIKDTNQEQLLLNLAQHAIKREQFEDLAKIKFKEKGFDLRTISSGRDSDGHFYNVSYLDSKELKSMKVKTKNQKDVVAEENLDQLLNQLEECKCKVVKPNETTWVLDRSECNLCHKESIMKNKLCGIVKRPKDNKYEIHLLIGKLHFGIVGDKISLPKFAKNELIEQIRANEKESNLLQKDIDNALNNLDIELNKLKNK